MLWKIQEICSKMGTKIFEIDEEMSEIIDAKVGNSQNSTSIKSANLSQPWNVAFFQDYIFKKNVNFQSQGVPKWKIAHKWQSNEHKNNKITPKNVSQKGLQSLPDVLQHPVCISSVLYCVFVFSCLASLKAVFIHLMQNCPSTFKNVYNNNI